MRDSRPHKLQGGIEYERTFAGAIRDLIFGAEDGLVSILGLVTGVAAGTTNSSIVLLAGVVGALSGAISMGAGNYLGAKSHIEVLQQRLREEEKNIRERPEMEHEELVDYYRERGMTEEEMQTVVPAVERNKSFILEEMSAHELGITPANLRNPVWKAFWIFVAYVIAAVFPVLPYALFVQNIAMPVSIIGTVLALFAIGAAKTIYTGRSPIKSGLEMLAIAAMAGIAGYLAGRIAAVSGV